MFQRSNEEGLSGYENQAWSLDILHKDSPTQEEVTCRIKMAQKSSKWAYISVLYSPVLCQ